jgi:hypothetical protein
LSEKNDVVCYFREWGFDISSSFYFCSTNTKEEKSSDIRDRYVRTDKLIGLFD